MRRLLYPDNFGAGESIGLLAVRLTMGAALMFHGWPKIQQPMGWMGPEATMPGGLQAAAAMAEFVGGGAMIIGLLTRPFALLIAITMAVGATMVHMASGDPFVGKRGQSSWELAAIYFACSLLLLLAGPGLISLDALLFRRRSDVSPELAERR